MADYKDYIVRYDIQASVQNAAIGLKELKSIVTQLEVIHYRQDILAGIRFRTRFLMPEQILQESPSLMVAKLDKEPFYLILKQDHKHQQTNPHELIQDCTYQLKVQNLGGEHPHHNERKHTKEYIDSAALLHYPVKIKQEQRHYGYIKRISNTKLIQGLKD